MIFTPNDGPLREPSYGVWACCTCECWRGDKWGHKMPDYTIDAREATARRADDKAKVDKFIEEGPGFARVNQMMERELRRTATRYAWGEAINYWCCCCQKMGWVSDAY